VGVDLRRGELRVTEQFLHETQIRAGIEQVRGIAVPQFVRREIEREPGQRQVAFQQQLHLAHPGLAGRRR
jgi:hypothetical protein